MSEPLDFENPDDESGEGKSNRDHIEEELRKLKERLNHGGGGTTNI